MLKVITILVTGVGGPLGQAILKALAGAPMQFRILGVDRTKFSVGLSWVDKGFVLPDSSCPEAYLPAFREICANEQPDLIFPGSHGELQLLSQHAQALKEDIGAVVVASSPEVLRIGLNKWETVGFLQRSGLNFPRTARVEDAEEVRCLIKEFGFPLIAKPVGGAGSQNLFKIKSKKEIEYVRSLGIEMILQEYLWPDDQEYTVGVYTLKNGQTVGAIAMKRELAAGVTYRARVDRNPRIEEEAIAVVKALHPFGPCNVQLRLTERGPVTFEINPRFSGTTGMRAHFGYNEAEMAIRDLVLDQVVATPQVEPGVALRFWDEIYLDEQGENPSRKGHGVQSFRC